MMGSPIGGDSGIAEWLQAKARSHKQVLTTAKNIPGVAEVDIDALIRGCVDAKHAHLAECVLPHQAGGFAKQIDDETVAVYENQYMYNNASASANSNGTAVKFNQDQRTLLFYEDQRHRGRKGGTQFGAPRECRNLFANHPGCGRHAVQNACELQKTSCTNIGREQCDQKSKRCSMPRTQTLIMRKQSRMSQHPSL